MMSRVLQTNRFNVGPNRRNSSLEMRQGVQGNYIRKHYHRRFRVEQEYQAYLALDPVLKQVSGIRRAEIFAVNESSNTIDIEFIDGPTLAEEFTEHGVDALKTRIDCLLLLFQEARKQRVQFDSDPSNLIYERRSNSLVLIDPVCDTLDIADYSLVVFLWGLIKCFFQAHRYEQTAAFRNFWLDTIGKYQKACHVSHTQLNGQMCLYIDRVIHWNQTESQNESSPRRWGRHLCLVPAYRIIQLGFKYHWAIPG